MHKLLFNISICILLTACGGSSNNSTRVTPPVVEPPAVDPYIAVREAAHEDLRENPNSPAVSVAIFQQGEIVFAEAFGHKQLGGSEPVGKDTLFQLGSITKMLTGLATLKLVDEGLLHLDAPLVQALAPMEYPHWQSESWQSISLHHLLTHQSGLYDDYSDETVNLPLVNAMRDAHPQETRLMNPPGKFYNYSNPNFSYLGALVENQTQTDYRQWMKREIFTPLAMENTTMLYDDVVDYDDYALGVRIENGRVFAAQNLQDIPNHPAAIPSGSYTWSTPSDLVQLAAYLFDGERDFLDSALKDQMTTRHIEVDHNTHYGYGIEVSDGFSINGRWYEEEIWYHGGFTQDYRAAFLMLPDQEIAIAILNSGPAVFDDTLIAAIEAVAELPPSQPTEIIAVDTASFPDHIGTYRDYGNDITFEVALEGDTLTLNIPEFEETGQQYSRQLSAIGNGFFVAESEGKSFYFSFIPEQDGGESVYMRSREAVGIKLGFEPWSSGPE